MLMVDAALKRRYLDDHTKKLLLVNSYAVWLAFLHVNLLWMLVVPALRSMRYLPVVRRYQLN